MSLIDHSANKLKVENPANPTFQEFSPNETGGFSAPPFRVRPACRYATALHFLSKLCTL